MENKFKQIEIDENGSKNRKDNMVFFKLGKN